MAAINRRPASSAKSVGGYLVWFGQRHGDPLTNLKLQKLLYYAQGIFLVEHNRLLFEEPLQAWVRGPVVYEVWKAYNHHKWEPISDPIDKPRLSDEVLSSLNTLIERYWEFSAYKLERMTHEESPWLNARKGVSSDTPSSATIKIADIYEHFVALRNGREKTAQ